MKYQRLHTNSEHYYSIGVDEETGRYVMEVVITWIAWYSIYFWLTDAEVADFKRDPNALTDLSQEMAADKGQQFFADRLIYSEKAR